MTNKLYDLTKLIRLMALEKLIGKKKVSVVHWDFSKMICSSMKLA